MQKHALISASFFDLALLSASVKCLGMSTSIYLTTAHESTITQGCDMKIEMTKALQMLLCLWLYFFHSQLQRECGDEHHSCSQCCGIFCLSGESEIKMVQIRKISILSLTPQRHWSECNAVWESTELLRLQNIIKLCVTLLKNKISVKDSTVSYRKTT